MAIKSYSELEELLAAALEREGIAFEQQYMVYERARDLAPKYTLDFMIRVGEKMIDIECDGATYHTDAKKQKSDDYRNAWLYLNGFAQIIRFDTIDIKYNINFCTNTIKKAISKHTDQEFSYKQENRNADKYRKTIAIQTVENIDKSTELNKVNIYAASCASSYEVGARGAIAFQLEDTIRGTWSEEFCIAYSNVNVKQCQALSILEALRKMKLPSELNVFVDSRWLSSVSNDGRLLEASKKLADCRVFAAIDSELKKHNYRFIYVSKVDGKYTNNCFRNLISRAKQKLKYSEEFDSIIYNPDKY